MPSTQTTAGLPQNVPSRRWPIGLRRLAAAALGGLALWVALSSAYWQYRSTFAIPYWDQWSAVFDYLQLRSGNVGLRSLFSQSNEHRILFPRLIMYADLRWFAGRNAFNVLMSDVFQCAHIALLLWTGRSVLKRSFAGWATAAFMAAAMLTGSQYENIYWGFQSQFVMVFLFASAAFAAAAALPPAVQGRPASAALAVTAILCAVVSSFSMANGLLVWPVLLAAVLQRRAGLAVCAAVLLAGAASTAFYLHGYVPVASHTPATAALSRPIEAGAYFLAYLGAVVSPQDPQTAMVAGAGLLTLLTVLGVRRATGRDRLDGAGLAFWCVSLFVILSAALTMIGRFEFGLVQALSPRYVTPGAALWSAAAVLSLDASRSAAARGACCLAIALMTAWLALVDQPMSFDRMADHERKMLAATDAVLAGVTDPATLSDLGPSAETTIRVSALLRPSRLSVFAAPEAGWMGQAVDRVFQVDDDPSCIGSVDAVRPFGREGADGSAVAGWAWDGSEGHGPAELVFTDEDGTIVGFARGQLARPDVSAKKAVVRSDRVGWRGFLAPGSGSSVQPYAVKDGALRVCPLGP